MKAQELIKILKNHKDFDIECSLGMVADNSEWGATLKSFKITGIADIGYSDKRIILNITEDK